MAETATGRMMRALNKLGKWRTVLAGWHMGTQGKSKPGVQAMRDLREAVMIQRVEINALTGLLLARRVFTLDELQDAIGKEAVMADGEMAVRFPGYRSDPDGIEMFDAALAQETHRRLGFPG